MDTDALKAATKALIAASGLSPMWGEDVATASTEAAIRAYEARTRPEPVAGNELVDRLDTVIQRLTNAVWESGAASEHVRRVIVEATEICRECRSAIASPTFQYCVGCDGYNCDETKGCAYPGVVSPAEAGEEIRAWEYQDVDGDWHLCHGLVDKHALEREDAITGHSTPFRPLYASLVAGEASSAERELEELRRENERIADQMVDALGKERASKRRMEEARQTDESRHIHGQ